MWQNPLTYTAIVAALGLLVTLGILIFKSGAWKGRVDAFMKDTKEALDTLKETLDTLLMRTEPAIERSSPVRLTEFGKEIAARIEAEEWASQTAPGLLDEIRGKEAFQVDEFCAAYVRQRLTDEQNTEVAKVAFAIGTTRESVLAALRVVLRDKLLSAKEPAPAP